MSILYLTKFTEVSREYPYIRQVNVSSSLKVSRPKPNHSGQGWEITEAGLLERSWTTRPILPSNMIELIASDYVKDHTGIVEIDDEENYIEVEMEDRVEGV